MPQRGADAILMNVCKGTLLIVLEVFSFLWKAMMSQGTGRKCNVFRVSLAVTFLVGIYVVFRRNPTSRSDTQLTVNSALPKPPQSVPANPAWSQLGTGPPQLTFGEKKAVLPVIAGMRKVVHLDLKGAPPTVGYLKLFFHLIRKWGATGVLIEWEDTFPYSGDLEEVVAPHAYTPAQAQEIVAAAESSGLDLIPLVQTFGHLEFLLEHPKFVQLRKDPHDSQAIDPDNPGTLRVINDMISQVLAVHKNSKYFHIGCDEVYFLKKASSEKEKIANAKLFLSHVMNVAGHVKKTSINAVQPLMWDDMFRHTEYSLLKSSGIQNFVEPMVWMYLRRLHLSDVMWTKYASIFNGVWIASAFKGATGPSKLVTDINHHYLNHMTWLQTVARHHKRLAFRGLAITGWQRYDHFSLPCELLPAGLPALAVSLSSFIHGGLSTETKGAIVSDLGCEPMMSFTEVDVIPNSCQFPGKDIYTGMIHVHRLSFKLLKFHEINDAWLFFGPENVPQSNHGRFQLLEKSLADQLRQIEHLEEGLKKAMEAYYPDVVYREIHMAYVKPKKVELENARTAIRQKMQG